MKERLCKWLWWKLLPAREPDFIVGVESDPYLMRWWIIPRNRWFNIYLHWIRHSDSDRALHDHPWASLSLMLTGELTEYYETGHEAHKRTAIRFIKSGQLTYRSAHFLHRLEVHGDPSKPRGAWTLFITGPKLREWGFACEQGWRHWREFGDPDNGNGKGCDP